jgi:ABC-2 type transport system ATP-binding protein
MNPVEVDHLTRAFGGLLAVNGVSFHVRPGTVLGLLGRNGAGKSTLLKLLVGHLQPTSGRLTVLGNPRPHHDPSRWLRLGYVSQAKHLPDWMTGEECLALARSFRPQWDRPHVASLVQRLGVPVGQKVGSLSRGHYTRLQVCIALGHHPELILLDEPTSGLDPAARQELLAILIEEIARSGAAVVLSSHLVEDVERLADAIAVMEGGRLIDWGPSEEVLASLGRRAWPAPECLPSD